MTLIREEFDRPILGGRDDDDEGLFSRDFNGQLVRLEKATESDYVKSVKVQVDGEPVTVPLAEPLKDAQGTIVLDINGRTTPRYTTIYDAAVKLYGQRPGEGPEAHGHAAAPAPAPGDAIPLEGEPAEDAEDAATHAAFPIPTLCHQQHMRPVAVCRLCVVQIYGQKRGKRAPERKLLPACQHPVKDGMEVFTMNAPGPDGLRVRQAVNVLTELLSADCLKPAPAPAPAAELAPFNELQQANERLGLKGSRFKLEVMSLPAATPRPASADRIERGSRGLDSSSPVFLVDHSACILCDRCSRACVEVKGNDVIGRVGKGPTAGIGFDLNDPMGESSCVSCGECMVSCPTSAITFKPVAKVKPRPGTRRAEVMTAAELFKDPLFAEVPPKFLLWQEGLVLRRHVRPGEVLCRQGEPGNTAFFMKRGKLEVQVYAKTAHHNERRGLISALVHGKAQQDKPALRLERSPDDIILGEMACMSGTPRTADVVALEDGEVWEMRRNVLDRLLRSPALRQRIEESFRKGALDNVLRGAELFQNLPEDEHNQLVDYLRPKLTFVRVNPKQTIFKQGDWADAFFLVRLGHVRVSISKRGFEERVLFRGPAASVGESGLLAIGPEDRAKDLEKLDSALASALNDAGDELGSAVPSGTRSATCSALDHVELARVDRLTFLGMVKLFPTLRRRLIEMALGRVGRDSDDRPAIKQYVEQGLYQGQSLLVMDLQKCTRCDECVRACVDQHGTSTHGAPVTRLKRDGLRFGDFLVASSCRSCKDAYCMIGCPVDSIHRGKHQQIVIEDHCIGCGLCADNCPFGNIWMLPNENRQITVSDPDKPGQARVVAQPRATVCDLCDAEGHHAHPTPRCVYACPHDAAHRMTGEELLAEVTGRKPASP